MKKPKYFFSRSIPWDLWDATWVSLNKDQFALKVGNEAVFRRKSAIDARYPGFISAYEMLTAIGCDKNFVTSVLKFCVTQCQKDGLDDFLIQSKVLQEVHTALSVGASGDDLVTTLERRNSPVIFSSLPDDLAPGLGG